MSTVSHIPSSTRSVILSRLVSLICQGLTQSPQDAEVWLDGLRMLSDPKLHRSLAYTISIWLPLLQQSLSPGQDPAVTRAGLMLLGQVADVVEPMKNAFIKPFRTLKTQHGTAEVTELATAMARLGISLSEPGEYLASGRSAPVRLSTVGVCEEC